MSMKIYIVNRNIFRHLISENGLLPIQNEMYDIVTSAGTFIPNHAPATAVKVSGTLLLSLSLLILLFFMITLYLGKGWRTTDPRVTV